MVLSPTLLWCLALLQVNLLFSPTAHCLSPYATQFEWIRDFTFAQAQCKAICFKIFVENLQAQSRLTNKTIPDLEHLRQYPLMTEKLCHKRTSCRLCAQVGCKVDPRGGNCQEYCKGEPFCVRGCKEVLRQLKNKPGTCPTGHKLLDPRSPIDCRRACSTDFQCSFMPGQKCCPGANGCGTRCITAHMDPTNLPPRPQPTLSRGKKRSFNMIWEATTDYTRPVVYVVQLRYVIGHRFLAGYASKWHNLTMTTKRAVEVQEMEVGYIYQFQVAAVSPAGTLGFGTPSVPVRIKDDPRPPFPPRNVMDGVWRIYASGTVNVNILWSKPLQSDLPIYAYEISWVRDHGYVQSDGKSVLSFTRYKKSVPHTQRRYVIAKLKPSTSYKVEVRAKCKWGDRFLLSRPNTIYITTPSIKDSAKNSQNSYSDKPCRCDDKQDTAKFTITKPMFDGKLVASVRRTHAKTIDQRTTYMVEWTPRVCIDDGGAVGTQFIGRTNKATMKYRSLEIGNLRFNCRYKLRVTPLNADRTPSRTQNTFFSCFCTPSCLNAEVRRGSIATKMCEKSSEPEVPGPPVHLKIEKTRQSGVYLVRWRQPASRHPLTGYRVVWGPRLEEPVSKESYNKAGLKPPLDESQAMYKVVPRNVTQLVLRNLKRASLYIVKVQALSYLLGRESESLPESEIFSTQGFQPPSQLQTPNQGEVSKYVKSPVDSTSLLSANLTLVVLCILTILPLRRLPT